MTDRQYTSSAKISAFLKTTITADLASYILAAQRYIEEYTGKVFKAGEEEEARVFDGNGEDFLLIDECVLVSKVEVGQDSYGENFTEILNSGSDRYFLKPDNYDKFDPKQPIYMIELSARLFSHGRQNHRITGKWGSFVACPDDVGFAATVIAAGMYNASSGGEGKKAEKIGNYSVTYAEGNWSDLERAKEILKQNQNINI